ncbi:unnamed protein product [Sphenostylis stenocarpa]|uniref:Uncharacterized protein n=1 Tax=Sphenostylis stenocarpa TaxID=92480 RepID=A0AA86VZF7_9FABA|nr:unnamed protein product [Sphenostylis stenocarpa]
MLASSCCRQDSATNKTSFISLLFSIFLCVSHLSRMKAYKPCITFGHLHENFQKPRDHTTEKKKKKSSRTHTNTHAWKIAVWLVDPAF